MCMVLLKNLETNQVFEMEFNSPYLYYRFLKRIKYSKKLKLLCSYNHHF